MVIEGYHQRRQVVRENSTPKCLPKQGIIAAQSIHTTRKVKQTNGKDNVIVRSNRELSIGLFDPMLGVIPTKERQGCYRGHPKLSRGKEGVSHHEFNRHLEGKKNLQSSKLQRIIDTSESFF